MKRRRFIKPCMIVLTGVLSFSCIDNSYDLTNLSTKMELFGNSLALPIGYKTVYLDSIIGGMDVDTSTLRVENGTYVFRYAGSMDMSGLTSSMSNFELGSIPSTNGSVDLYAVPSLVPTPFDIPADKVDYPSSASISLPSFSTNLIAVDSIKLKDTKLQIELSNQGLSGKVGESFSITFTPQGNTADYYVNNEEVTSWTVNMGESIEVEIKKLRLSTGADTLAMNVVTHMNIKQTGDVQAQDRQTRLLYTMSVNSIDFEEVYGKVNYNQSNRPLDPISFDALGSIIGANDVLSFYNPNIVLTTRGNLGVPVDFTLNMGTLNSSTGSHKELSNTTFKMEPAESAQQIKTNTFEINKENGTSELFKINPDQITIGYSFATDVNSVKNHFIAKSSQLSMDYAMEIPLQFGSDLELNMGTTIESPAGDMSVLDEQEDLAVGLALNVKNHIPLTMKLVLTALDEDSIALFTTMSDEIEAAPVDNLTGKSTGFTPTSTELLLKPEEIDKLKDTKKFRVGFVITAKGQASFVTVQPTDYIDIKVGARLENGLIIDPEKMTNNE